MWRLTTPRSKATFNVKKFEKFEKYGISLEFRKIRVKAFLGDFLIFEKSLKKPQKNIKTS